MRRHIRAIGGCRLRRRRALLRRRAASVEAAVAVGRLLPAVAEPGRLMLRPSSPAVLLPSSRLVRRGTDPVGAAIGQAWRTCCRVCCSVAVGQLLVELSFRVRVVAVVAGRDAGWSCWLLPRPPALAQSLLVRQVLATHARQSGLSRRRLTHRWAGCGTRKTVHRYPWLVAPACLVEEVRPTTPELQS